MRCRIPLALALVATLIAPAAMADHADGSYDQPLWSSVKWPTTTVLDVLIVPPNHGQLYNGNGVSNGLDPFEQHPLEGSYLRAIENSIADWDRAIVEYGAAWLVAGLATNVYVIGRDSIPEEAIKDPEIVIFTDETKATILGVAISGNPCKVDNSKLFTRSMTYQDMFNINAQEYGHCLGLEHVAGDVDRIGGNRQKGTKHDAMNGSYPDGVGAAGVDLHCVSNLNVKGVEEVFRQAITGAPGAAKGVIAVADYVRPVTSSACHT